MVLLVVKIVLSIILVMELYKVLRARKLDSTLKIKLDFRSKVETGLILGLDILILFYRPQETTELFFVLGGQLMILLTFIYSRRLVFVGQNNLYLLQLNFLITDVTKVSYDKLNLSLKIQNNDIKVRLPISAKDYLMERFSGKQFR